MLVEGALGESYAGVSGNAALGVGLGAKVLIGGSVVRSRCSRVDWRYRVCRFVDDRSRPYAPVEAPFSYPTVFQAGTSEAQITWRTPMGIAFLRPAPVPCVARTGRVLFRQIDFLA